MMKKIMTMTAAGCLAALVCADEGDGFNGDLFSGWRLTVGGAMNGSMRTKVGIRTGGAWTRGVHLLRPGLAGSSLPSSAAVQAQGASYGDFSSGRVDFPNGGFIDPNDAAGIPGETWNWWLPSGSLDAGGSMSIVSSYADASFTESFGHISGKDDGYAPGVSAGLDRLVWQWGDFGVDAGFIFSYFRKSNFFKTGGRAWTRTDTTVSGDYITDVAFDPGIVLDPWSQNADGSYGAGTYDGPGPVLNFGAGDVTVSHRWANETVTSRTSSFALRARGDYEEIEMIFALRPWYDVTDWFRVQGTLGAAVSRTHFAFDVYGRGDGGAYASRQKFDDWAVYGVGGLGGTFHYACVCLGFDFLARFFDSDIDINGRDVHGSIARSPWMFRVYAGLEF